MPVLIIQADEHGDLWLGDFTKLIAAAVNEQGQVVVTALLRDQQSRGFAPMGLVFEVEAAMHLLAVLHGIAEAHDLEVPAGVVRDKGPPTH